MTDKEKIEVARHILLNAQVETCRIELNHFEQAQVLLGAIEKVLLLTREPMIKQYEQPTADQQVENVLRFIGRSVDNMPESKKPTQSTGRKCESCGEGDDVRFVVSGDANFPLIVCITCFDILGAMRGWKRHKPLMSESN